MPLDDDTMTARIARIRRGAVWTRRAEHLLIAVAVLVWLTLIGPIIAYLSSGAGSLADVSETLVELLLVAAAAWWCKVVYEALDSVALLLEELREVV